MRIPLVLLLILASHAAHAAWITLEPDDVADGTDVTNYWDGVTLRSVEYQPGGTYVFSRVYVGALDPSHFAPTGTNVFTNTGGQITGWQGVERPSCVFTLTLCGTAFRALLIDFLNPVAAVTIQTRIGADGAGLWLYDEDYQLVTQCREVWSWTLNPCFEHQGTNPVYGENYMLSAISEVANVRYAIVGGIIVPTTLDAISYSVPEPGTLALLGVGLLGFGLRRRRHSVTPSHATTRVG